MQSQKDVNGSAAYAMTSKGVGVSAQLSDIKDTDKKEINIKMPNWDEEEEKFDQVIANEVQEYEKNLNIQFKKSTYQEYRLDKIIAHGSFGIVYEGTHINRSKKVAIKKIFLDRRFKNRELEILEEVCDHPYIMKMIANYLMQGEKPNDQYLHIVSELQSETVG